LEPLVYASAIRHWPPDYSVYATLLATRTNTIPSSNKLLKHAVRRLLDLNDSRGIMFFHQPFIQFSKIIEMVDVYVNI
jgi:hypothetical protein